MAVRIAQVVPDTEAEGPGRRFAVWVQGCPIRCPGCCNPQMFEAAGGEEVEPEALADRALSTRGIEGVSLLGGEPVEQAGALALFAERVRAGGLSVMVYTGYRMEELKARRDEAVERLLAACDLVVDGRYEQGLPEKGRRWIGSSNQEIHFLTSRYSLEDFAGRNTVEVRIVGGEIVVNGWPELADRLLGRLSHRRPRREH